MEEGKTMKRRTLLKALAGIPVLGFFAYEAVRKINFDKEKKSRVIKELGLDDIKAPEIITASGNKGDVLRLGFIGFGSRAGQLSHSLGFMHPDQTKAGKRMVPWPNGLNRKI